MSATRFDLETALAAWRHQYTYSRAFKGRDLDELEQHLRDHVDYLVTRGASPEEAFRRATRELGDFAETESAYRAVAFMKIRDRNELTLEIAHYASMLLNYFRVALRNLKKNRTSSIINLLSLSVAIGVTLVSFVVISNFLTEDFFHENADEIFMVHEVRPAIGAESGAGTQAKETAIGAESGAGTQAKETAHSAPSPAAQTPPEAAASIQNELQRAPRYDNPNVQWYGTTPAPLAPAIKESVPGVVHATRILDRRAEVGIGDNNFTGVHIRFVDPAFLDMFTFPLKAGTPSATANEGEVLLSAAAANRFFGEDDPMGKTINLRVSDAESRPVTVTGIAQEFPPNTDINFDLLMSYSVTERLLDRDPVDWSVSDVATFVQLRSSSNAAAVERALAPHLPKVNAERYEQPVQAFALDNLKKLTRHREQVQNSIIGSVPWAGVIVLTGLSALILLLACFNYMNITIATATKRLREIGVRKVMGAGRGQVAFQFFAENLLLCTFALAAGLWLAWQFILPAFNAIASLNLEVALLTNWRLWIFLVVLVIGTGIVSGLYPALYVSGFRPTVIFRGMLKHGRTRPLTTAFQGFQFMLAFLSLAAGVTLVLNGRYYADRDAGYDTTQTVVFRAENAAQMDLLKRAADETPSVADWTTAENTFGRNWKGFTTEIEGHELDIDVFGVSPYYPALMDLVITRGRMPDAPDQILINETFVRESGLKAPVGTAIEIDSTIYTVTGVLKDYHYEDFFALIKPAVLRLTPPESHRYLVAKTSPGDRSAAANRISRAFRDAFPDKQASYYFQGDMFDRFRDESTGLTAIFLFISILALLISVLSIYALSAQNVLNRMREVGVRKVLGARPLGIAQRINRKIIVVLAVAALASAPVGYEILEQLLDQLFAYHMEMTAMPFVLAFIFIVATAVATIAIQVRTIQRTSPAAILRKE